jgi:protein-S-isoprenylcysteine O-methyltransferase Ste14
MRRLTGSKGSAGRPRGVKPLPYTNTGAGIAFYVVFGMFLALEWRTRIMSGLNRGGSRRDRGSLVVVWSFVAGGLVLAFVAAGNLRSAAIEGARWPLFVIGLALMLAGIALRQWSVAQLGRYFTTDVRIHEHQTVVDTGPYRWVRHPSYTGLLLTLVGVGLALTNWASLAILIVLPTIGVVARIRVEERALTEGLGEPYRQFAQTRAHLIPRIW